MFKCNIDSKIKPGYLLGFYNIEINFLLAIKNSIEEEYHNNVHYIEITSDKIRIQKIKRRKDKDYDELGMISISWIEKVQESLPAVIIQMIDITDMTSAPPPIDVNKIFDTIIKEISKIKSSYHSSNQFIIIKNLKKLHGFEDSIKSQVFSKFKFLKEKSIFFINDNNYINNLEIKSKIGLLVKDQISSFYVSKMKYYRSKFKDNENNEQKEFAIKYLIKIYIMSKISNIIKLDNSINYYDYIQKAYNILSKTLIKKSYLFCEPNVEIIYLELKNVADVLMLQLLSQNNTDINVIIRMIINHLINFDFVNFYNDKKIDINIIENMCKKKKHIYYINMLWKHDWYSFLLNNYKDIDLLDINHISLKGYIMDNLFHLYQFLINEPNFTQDINAQFNVQISYKKIKNKYLEKIPKFYEIDGVNLLGKLTAKENFGIYIIQLIFGNKAMLVSENIVKILENLIFNSKTNYYDYYLLNKYCIKNNDNENFADILGKLLHKNNNYLIKFPNVYSHLSTKLNEFILNCKIENKDKNNFDIYKMIEYLILYASLSQKELTTDEINKINELLSYELNVNNNLVKINSFENNLFYIDVSYNTKEVKPLDIITTNININLVRKDIIMDIDKIIVYFPKSNKNENEKYYKEISLNQVLSKDNPINISFNTLVKFFFKNLYVFHIQLYLKNKLIINLTNKEKRNFVFHDKNSNLINENDIIKISLNKIYTHGNDKKIIEKKNPKILLIGKKENHLFNINYMTKIDNEDVYIKRAKVTISLISGFNKIGEEIKSFRFKTFDEKGYKDTGNRQLILKYDNTNFEKNPPPFEYILQIDEAGSFGINYLLSFTLINKKCPDDYHILQMEKNLVIQTVDSFKYSSEVNSSLYYINQQNYTKVYPINYPINIISYLENELSENIIIKNIIYIPTSKIIEINSPIEKLFSKKTNYKIYFSSNEKVSFHSKIISKRNSTGHIGQIKILWISEHLFYHINFNESMLNESIFDLNNLIINKMPLIIQGKYINKVNKYQLKIKNLESISKIIKFSIKEINRSKPKEEKFILCGKTDINEILLPSNELNIQYNIYDKKTGASFLDINDNITYKFNNLITLNEYYILDNNALFDSKSLRNIIYYIPEIFKLSN